jgi:hypothetical protein
MKDELYKKILEKLNESIDGELFEACTVDLLQNVYKSLSPFEGGGDGGRDGMSLDIQGREVLFVATTNSSVITNLSKNLAEYSRQGFKGREVIVATSRRLSPKKHDNLVKKAEECGLSLIKVHSQDDMALRLYRNPTWLKKLLGLSSNSQALSIDPATGRKFFGIDITGRESELSLLSTAEGDLLVAGQPGSGKSFLLQKYAIENGGLFVVSKNADQIASEVREKNPSCLIIDDADSKVDDLLMLQQIRIDTGAEFKIIATCWPSHSSSLLHKMSISNKSLIHVELLSRDTIVEVIKNCGVASPDILIKQMVDQSEGKPGMATTLANLVLLGNANEVYIGDALGEHLVALFAEDDEEILDILSVISVAGESGASVQTLSKILDKPEVSISRLVAGLSYGGIVSENEDGKLCVRPSPLRYYLAKKTFLSGAKAADPFAIMNYFDSKNDTLEVLLNATLRGGSIDLEALYEYVKQSGNKNLFSLFAATNKKNAIRVIKKHPNKALAAPMQYLQDTPEEFIPKFLDKAINDNRELHSNPNHPLRVLSDWVKQSNPRTELNISNRKALLRALKSWKNLQKYPSIATQVIKIAFSPAYEKHSNDPGSGRTLSWTNGIISSRDIDALEEMWTSDIEEIICQIPIRAWSHLVELLHSVAYESSTGMYTLNDMQETALGKLTQKLAESMNNHSTEYDSVQTEIQAVAEAKKLKIEQKNGNSNYQVLYPTERTLSKFREEEKKFIEAAKSLARKHIGSDPDDTIKMVVDMHNQADAVNKNYPDLTDVFCREIALNNNINLLAWADASIKLGDRVEVSGVFIEQVVRRLPKSDCDKIVNLAFYDLKHRGTVSKLIMQGEITDEDLVAQLVDNLDDFARQAEIIALRGEMSEEIAKKFMTSKSNIGSMWTASGYAYAKKSSNSQISEIMYPLWRDALINYKLTGNWNIDHYLVQALEFDSSLYVKWFAAQLPLKHKSTKEQYFDGFSKTAKDLIDKLSYSEKKTIISSLTENDRSRSIANKLVGNDVVLYRELLKNTKTKDYNLVPLINQSGTVWVDFVEAALNGGVEQAEVESYCKNAAGSWSGPASQYYKSESKRFNHAIVSENEIIVAIAKSCKSFYENLSKERLVREKKEDILGFW